MPTNTTKLYVFKHNLGNLFENVFSFKHACFAFIYVYICARKILKNKKYLKKLRALTNIFLQVLEIVTTKCEICQVNLHKYKCPGCGMKSNRVFI